MHISLKAEELFHIGLLPITNSLLLAIVVCAVLAALALTLRLRLAFVPGAVQNAFEFFIEGALGIMAGVLGSRSRAERYLPLVATIFLFILASNWLGLFPGIGSIVVHGEEHAPLLRPPTSDLNFTLALAVLTVITVNVLGVLVLGFRRHMKKFFNLENPVAFFIGILEFISELAKMVSFSFRLFGNIFAGEVLLTIIAFLVPYVIPLPFLFLEIFVGFVQALIFSMLTVVFIAIATAEHGTEGH